MRNHEIIICGGGASGCLCALLLKEAGLDVAIMEAQDRILKKVLVTGNGRCNISNEKLQEGANFSDFYSSLGQGFDPSPLKAHDVTKISAYFEELGLPLTALEEGKLYPRSLQAASVSDLIRLRLKELSVPVYLNSRIRSIHKKGSGFVLTTASDQYGAARVVLSPGGMAMPSTGSDGSFYKILRELGHKIQPPLPALVQLKTDFPQARALSGVKVEGRLSLLQNDQPLVRYEGEIHFADYGLSGIPSLQISRFASPLLARGEKPTVLVSLFPKLSQEAVLDLLLKQKNNFPNREIQMLFNGLVNKKIIPVVLRTAGVDKMNRPARDISLDIFKKVANLLTAWPMTITGTQGFAQAQSTLGGVDLKEVDGQTLESNLAKNLYLTGEVLDVCGACGGFNLQWSWASAFAVADAIKSRQGV